MKRILDRNFRYRPSHETDIRKTFERVRREMSKAQERADKKVVPIALNVKQR